MTRFEALTDAELAQCVGSLASSELSVRPSHVVYKLTGIGTCGCGLAHD